MNQTIGRTMTQAMGLPKRTLCNGVAATKQSRPVVCRVAAEAPTAWDAWDTYMAKKSQDETRKIVTGTPGEKENLSEITSAISKASVGYKPKFNVPHDTHGAVLKVQHLSKLPGKELPKDLHDKLEVIGAATLKGALAVDGEIDYANVSYTTTDIDGALSITGAVVQKGSEKNAVVVFIATETEREASWSRLEGLVLHWACGTAPGGAWSMPPEGWTATPSKLTDAGGAWQCEFEQQKFAGNEKMYVLVMTLPVRGVLKSGGIVFVLKGMGNNTKADRWLKDASTEKDFFLELTGLPVIKV